MSFDQEFPLVSKTKKLLELRTAAAGIGAGLAISVIYKKDEIVKFFDNAEIGRIDYVSALQAICVVVIVILAILWIYTGTDELEDLQFWLRPLRYQPPRPIGEALSIFIIAILLAIGSLSAQESGAGGTDRDRRVQARIPLFEQGYRALNDYYMGRPHYLRIAILLGLFLIVAAPANYIHIYHLQHPAEVKAGNTAVPIPFGGQRAVSNFEPLAVGFYIYWLVLIIGSEALLNAVWRRRLKIELDDLREQLERLCAPNASGG